MQICSDSLGSDVGSDSKEVVQRYSGTMKHRAFGEEAIPIRVVMKTACHGTWTAFGKSEEFRIIREDSHIRMMDRSTELSGRETNDGVLKGVVVQKGEQDGEFELVSDAARFEVGGISDDNLKAELQRVVAQLDIETTTVGQVRSRLEANLGLPHGTLSASKRAKRWTGAVLQEEVRKKAQRSPDCERIVRALSKCSSYPDTCRQMLVEGLPSALHRNCNGGLHSHQVHLLEMAGSAIQEAVHQLVKTQEEYRQQRSQADACLQRLRAAYNAVLVEETTAKNKVGLAENALRISEEEVAEAEKNVARVIRNREEAIESRRDLENGVASANGVVQEALKLLSLGLWTNPSERDKAISEVEKFLMEELENERSLAVAMPEALSCLPVDRTAFYQAVVGAVSKNVATKTSDLERRLQGNTYAREDKRIADAKATHDAALSKAANDMVALSDIREFFETASAVCQVQRSEMEQQAAIVDEQLIGDRINEEQINEFKGVIALIQRFVISSCPTATKSNANSEKHQNGDGDLAISTGSCH